MLKVKKPNDPVPVFSFMRKMSDLMVYSELISLDMTITILDTVSDFFMSMLSCNLRG